MNVKLILAFMELALMVATTTCVIVMQTTAARTVLLNLPVADLHLVKTKVPASPFWKTKPNTSSTARANMDFLDKFVKSSVL